MTVTRSAFSTVTGDTTILATGTLRHTATLISNTFINFTTQVVNIFSQAQIAKTATSTISSSAKIAVNNVELKLYKESDPFTEVGTGTNPVIFTAANAGETTLHPDNAFLLYNDKTGALDSTDAKNITVEVIEMQIIDELVGVSNGTASQVFTVAFPGIIEGDSKNELAVRVGATYWTEVTTFAGASNTDEVFIVNYTTGTVTFGNNVNGKIPTNGSQILVTYSPNTTTYGKDTRDDGWFGIQSFDVDANDRTVYLVPSVAPDLDHVQLFHVPLISSGAILGVYLKTDPNRLATNYFTGGTYNDSTGLVTLGTTLPSGTTEVLVDYIYTIETDGEADFTQLSRDVQHTFLKPIPSKNAKKLNFRVVIPSGASPTNGVRVKFRLQFTYTEY